jgi:cell wall-associated NlpC family hydrolase
MHVKRTLTGGAFAATAFSLLAGASSLISTAHADLYHPVSPGETLNVIAARYRLSTDAIRGANQLHNTRDDAPLAAMLLLIPEGNSTLLPLQNKAENKVARPAEKVFSPLLQVNATTVNAPTGQPPVAEKMLLADNAASSASVAGSGSIVQMTRYVVQPGDTLTLIAEKFSKPGQTVSANEIRRRNYITGEPPAGTMLLVPVASANYGAAPRESMPTPRESANQSAPRDPLAATPGDGPRVLEQPTPVYQAPSASTGLRGNVLASRGMSTDNSVLLVQPGQETPSTGAPSPRARLQTQVRQSNVALGQVARVARSGGTIRRLPEAEAVALYRCGVGTELAVIKQNGSWSAILMSDRSTGWIPTKYLKMTGVKVDISTQVMTQPEQGTARGNFSSNHPMVTQALSWLGTRYVYGGTSRRGIDCSALVQNSFAACGVRLPRTAAQQSKVGTPVNPSDLRPGDRLYFSASGTRVDHTGLYMGNGQFVHASGRGRQVMVSNLFDRAHWNIFVGARR